MREFKFRTFVKKSEKMIYGTGAMAVKMFTPNYAYLNNEVEVMQYTGLKDKNGKEIYEGDIVEERWQNPLADGENVDRYEVAFSENGIYKMLHSSGEERWHRALFLRYKEVEVVGNVYEMTDWSF